MPGPSSPPLSPQSRRRLLWLAVTLVALCLAFVKPLWIWLGFAWQNDLYSHDLLIPFISLYFVRLNRSQFLPATSSIGLALFPLALGIALIGGYWWAVNSGAKLAPADSICLWDLSFISFIYAAVLAFFGRKNFQRFSFPALLLLFTSPFPTPVLEAIEAFLQYGSAYACHGMFWIAGLPFIRQGTAFQLPGITLQVAPQCSGIHSTLVLFITSIVAGHLFLKSRWNRWILTLAVIPLALLRNGFRVFTLGQLCVHVSPDMINSFIHHHGGPIFFALSLIPFFLLLLWLIRREQLIPISLLLHGLIRRKELGTKGKR
jgi:exosortase C (VPDSG-CTERM-specific)